jgi:hypothetical protein
MKIELDWFNPATRRWWVVRLWVAWGEVEPISAWPRGSKLRGTVSGPNFMRQVPGAARDWIESEALEVAAGVSNSTGV